MIYNSKVASPVAVVTRLSSSGAFFAGVRWVTTEVAGLVVGTWGPAKRLGKIPLSAVDLLRGGVASEDFVCLLSSLKRNGLAYNKWKRKWPNESLSPNKTLSLRYSSALTPNEQWVPAVINAVSH